MNVPKEIPAQSVIVDVQGINIYTDDRSAIVVLQHNGEKERISVNLLPIYQQGTSEQKQTIKIFLRQIVATALEVGVADIPDIFN